MTKCAWLTIGAVAVVMGGVPADLAAQTARVRTRTYVFKEAGRDSEYKLFVSSKYQAVTPAPLMMALHPFGTRPQGIMLSLGLLDLAEERGYLVVAPTGYDLRTWFSGPGQEASGALSEQDAMNVLAVVRQEYTVDPARIYLMGHSMGGGATWHFGVKYPDLWAALAPVAAAPRFGPDALSSITRTPVIVVHGDRDQSVSVEVAREWVARMKALGMTYEYLEIPGGDHTSILSRSPETMRRIFDFFDSVRR